MRTGCEMTGAGDSETTVCLGCGPLVGDETESVGLMDAWVVCCRQHMLQFSMFGPH